VKYEKIKPKAETVSLVRKAMEMVQNGTMVKDAIVIAGVSHTSYKEVRRWLAKGGDLERSKD
jgi:hypothetical protein